MTVDVTYPHIEKPPREAARLVRLPRIRVSQIVMDYAAYGWSAEEMCRQHPNLLPAEVHSALGYYFDHQAEIDGEIAAEWEQAEETRRQAPRSPFLLRLRARGTP